MEAREPRWALSRRVFLAGLGAVNVLAFLSLLSQVDGLYGEHGIVPIAATLDRLDPLGFDRWSAPSLLWWWRSPAALHGLCVLGIAAGVASIVGLAPRWSALVAWAAYLSFVSVGAPFLPFQWDALLLEAGLLAALYAPGGWRPFRTVARPPSRTARLLIAWLVFRVVFRSALVKLESGDEVWRDLTALQFHYWTQPLPHRLAHYVHHLPAWFHAASVVVMFAVELVAPILLFVPRVRGLRWAVPAGVLALVTLMVLIAATGNYGFFNLLTVVLCLALLDDRALRRCLPFRRTGDDDPDPEPRPAASSASRLVVGAVAVWTILMTLWETEWLPHAPRPLEAAFEHVEPFRSFNAYGLFADMTEVRPELVIEASLDGETWKPYTFRWKPGAVDRAPAFTGTHMPRLDWQLWFAALRGTPPAWFPNFLARLAEGSPDVVDLLEAAPFDTRPRYVRARLFRYRFSSPEERARGVWWTREFVGPFGPMARR